MTVTTDEAATIAGVDPTTIRQWVMRGDLEPVRRGAKPLRFRYEDVCRVQASKRPRRWREQHERLREAWAASTCGVDVSR